LVEHIITEQRATEIKIRRIIAGEQNYKLPAQLRHEKRIRDYITSVDFDQVEFDYLDYMSVMEVILQFEQENIVVPESVDNVINEVASRV
jgi:hypothetical protein